MLGRSTCWFFVATPLSTKPTNFVCICAAILIFIAGVTSGPIVRAESGVAKKSPIRFAQFLEKTDQTYLKIDQVIGSLDRSQFELDPMIDRLDYDAGAIIRFVTAEIAFQQYPGVLRGARGTLLSRAGNALDQSLLLAKLLRDAGFDARIIEGRLTDQQVSALLQRVGNATSANLSSVEAESVMEAIEGLKSANQFPQTLSELKNRLQASAGPQASDTASELSDDNLQILSALKKAGVSLDTKPLTGALRDEAAQYFWVEYKEGTSSPWRPVHPAFKEAPDSFGDLAAVKYFTSSIPEEYQQRVVLSVEIVQSIGGKSKVRQVISPWSRPTASLYGTEISFSNVPLNVVSGSSELTQEANLQSAEFFVPSMNIVPASSVLVFDLRGNVVPPDAAMDPAAGIFKQLNEKTGLASAALNAATATDGSTIADYVPKLVDQVLRIELHVPGRTPRILTKSLLPADVAAYDSAGLPTMALKNALTAQYTVGFALGDYPEQFLLDEALVRINRSRPAIDAVYASMLGGDEDKYWDMSRFVEVPASWGQMSALVKAMNSAKLPVGKVAYFGEPGVIVHRHRRDRYRDVHGSLDILTNTRWVLDVSLSEPRLDAASQALLGAWDTKVEALFYPRPTHADGADTESGQGRNAILLRAKRDMDSNDISASEESYRWMERDLTSGFSLLIPPRNHQHLPGSIAWWRVNEATGETLGMLEDGSGGAFTIQPFSVTMTEYLVTKSLSTALSALFAYKGYHDCMQATGEEVCCRDTAIGFGVVGGVLSGVIVWARAIESIKTLIYIELAVNGATAAYTSMDMFTEICQTTIFGANDVPGGPGFPSELLSASQYEVAVAACTIPGLRRNSAGVLP